MLLVEVAESSVRYDRGVKLPLYARAGILDLGECSFNLTEESLVIHEISNFEFQMKNEKWFFLNFSFEI